MDSEVITWCALSIIAVIGFFVLLSQADDGECVSERTLKRLRGEWYK